MIVSPALDCKKSEVELMGEIAAMINLARHAEAAGKRKLRIEASNVFLGYVQLVAGTRSHLYPTRLYLAYPTGDASAISVKSALPTSWGPVDGAAS